MKQRNVMIEIWRLIFSFLIVICHTVELPWYSPEVWVTRSTNIGVEFFFIISGYLMAKSAWGGAGPPPPRRGGVVRCGLLRGENRLSVCRRERHNREEN